MKNSIRAAWTSLALASALAGADPGVTLVGIGYVPGNALDKSGLDGKICSRDNAANCIPRATLGAFGSALTYTGHDNLFIGVPDRGPFDGRTTDGNPYKNRFHYLHIVVDVGAPLPNIRTTLLDTVMLKSEGQELLGDSSSFDASPLKSRRFDPEGVRVGPKRTIFISDEYGPYVYEFNRDGDLIRRLPVPAKFLIATPSGEVDDAGNSREIYPQLNTSGRQANRGMEGLAITPDGRYLVGIMQNALIQDGGLSNAVPPARTGVNNRMLKIDVETGFTQEFVYVMDSVAQGRGVNEMLAVNDHEFLVIERDNRSFAPTPPATPTDPVLKRIYRIDLSKPDLTDVSAIASLPGTAAELTDRKIVPVTKTLFLDLLDPAYKVDATRTIKDVIAEKIEAIAWGPDLSDGRKLLLVAADNDLSPEIPTKIYAFAVDPVAAKITYQPQVLPKRMMSRERVKKLVGSK